MAALDGNAGLMMILENGNKTFADCVRTCVSICAARCKVIDHSLHSNHIFDGNFVNSLSPRSAVWLHHPTTYSKWRLVGQVSVVKLSTAWLEAP